MAVDRMHIMASNQRLIRQIEKDLFDEAQQAWIKVYSAFCKRHGDLNPDRVMQFKYKGEHYYLSEDVPLRSGVKPIHKELEPEFQDAYSMFVQELEEEKRILKNMLAHAIRIAKYAEDLLELLPEIMHDSIKEAGFFQSDDKPDMQVEQAKQFKEYYEQYFGIFDLRKSVGALM